jgi:hypothetical protein
MKYKAIIRKIANSKGVCRPKVMLEEVYLVGAVVCRARPIRV